MNAYQTMKERHQKEFNEFPMLFTFSPKQFAEGMERLGLDLADVDKITAIGYGGYIRISDTTAFRDMFRRQKQEKSDAIEADATGDGFIYDMWYCELANHEYCFTYETDDAREALGLSAEDVENDPRMQRAMKRACRKQESWGF